MFGDDDKEDDVFPTPRKGKDRLPWLDEVPADIEEGVMGDNKQRMLLISGSLVVILLFGSLLAYIYNQNTPDNVLPENEVLLVHAPEGATKVEPKDRGGLNVPDQDRVVFDAVTGEDSQNGENIQRGPEQPLDRPRTDETENQVSNDSEATQDNTTQQAETTPTQTPASTPEATEAPQPEVQSQVQPQAQQPAAITPQPNFAGKYMIQLGAFGNRIGAENAWNTISQRFGGALSGFSPNYVSVQRTGATPLFRLRAGPLDTRQEADSVCDRLKASAQACFVVTP